MTKGDLKETYEIDVSESAIKLKFVDELIVCIDCAQEFLWTAGAQAFFHEKNLLHPPKRCKDCKKAKNRRLEAVELARKSGKRHRILVRSVCALCSQTTTLPFYPSQGRPVYCRQCYIEKNPEVARGASA